MPRIHRSIPAFQFASLAVGAKTSSKRISPGEVELCDPRNRYIVSKPREAYWRVLVRGCCAADAYNDSMIFGKYGHLERANAWTHLFACVAFLVFAFVRPWWLGAQSLTAQLSGITAIFTAITFAVSTVYHTYATVPFWGVGMRTLDHASIAISLAAANIADLSLVTLNFQDVPLQTILDPLIAALVLLIYFGARRWYVPREETKELQYTGTGCTLGLFRTFHSDLEHAALRASSTATLTMAWIMAIPAAWHNLSDHAAAVWITGASVGTALLVGGVILDNLTPIDNLILRQGNANYGPIPCASKTCGCVMHSHALWHVIAILAAVTGISAREYGISTL